MPIIFELLEQFLLRFFGYFFVVLFLFFGEVFLLGCTEFGPANFVECTPLFFVGQLAVVLDIKLGFVQSLLLADMHVFLVLVFWFPSEGVPDHWLAAPLTVFFADG
uniref:Replication protein B n=1 Tax=Lacticaseibacillus casei TaxID=1582 RepID=E3VVN3_LACCA|nr:replication protein B [Lacticaseibacillus casei]